MGPFFKNHLFYRYRYGLSVWHLPRGKLYNHTTAQHHLDAFVLRLCLGTSTDY